MKQKIFFVIRLLFGLMFINGGLNKIFNYMPPSDNLSEELVTAMASLMEISWLIPLVAVVEIIGGILFIIPRFKALGAIVIFPIVIGVLLTHTITEQSGMPIALALLAINLLVMYENREKYLPMVR